MLPYLRIIASFVLVIACAAAIVNGQGGPWLTPIACIALRRLDEDVMPPRRRSS